jgi:DNA-binding NarL/FixJ family response regulator
MERLYSTTLDTHLADLAHHFYEAGRWEKVLEYAQRAGEQAQRLYAWPAAIEHYTRALDSARHLALSPHPTLYRARGQAYEALGEFEAARHDYEQVLEAAHQGHDRVNEWQSLLDLGSLWAKRNYERAAEWFQRALELAQHLADPLLQAHTLNRMGDRYTFIAQPREALRCHQEALSIFQQVYDQRGIAETLEFLGLLSYGAGDLIEAKISYEQAIAVFRELDDRQRLASCLLILMLCMGTNYQNDLLVPAAASVAESLGHGEVALQLARGIGHRSLEGYALIQLGCCLGPHGGYAPALESLQAGLSILEEIEHHRWMIDANWILGALYLDLLAPSLAKRHLERALALAHETGSPGWVRMVTGLLASVCVQQQDLARAESVLGPLLSPQTRRMGQRMAWCARAELALAQKDPTLALHIVEQLIASAANSSSESVIPRLSHLRGKALAMLKQLVEAETALRDAHAAALTQGLRPLVWRVAIDLGKLYQTQHRDEEAEQAFATAQEVVKELAASIPDRSLREQFQQQAAALMPAHPSLSPRRLAKRAFGGLTEREREVAALIAQGKSNCEIAERLTVTERTVETHVRNILTKLDLTSRTQIAVWTITVGLTNNVL